MLSSKWHGHYSFTLDWNIQKLFIVLLPQEEIYTESGLSDETWPVGLQLSETVCCIYGLECVWLNGVKAVCGISLRHMQETSAEQKECMSRLCRPTLTLPGIKTCTQSLLTSVCVEEINFEYLFFTPQKTHEKWINLFWVCLIFSLNAYSSFLILRSVYFIVFVEGKNVAIFFIISDVLFSGHLKCNWPLSCS